MISFAFKRSKCCNVEVNDLFPLDIEPLKILAPCQSEEEIEVKPNRGKKKKNDE